MDDSQTKTTKLPDHRKGKPEWSPDIYQCRCCREIIFSPQPGEFDECKCGNWIDQGLFNIIFGNRKLKKSKELRLIQKGSSSEED